MAQLFVSSVWPEVFDIGRPTTGAVVVVVVTSIHGCSSIVVASFVYSMVWVVP